MNRVRATSPHGFTLIELLVVVAIIAVLIAVLLPALGRARAFSELTIELSAARQFNVAYGMYADDYDGRLLPGFPSNGMINRGEVVARDEHGQTLNGLEARRYPWRLLPYLDFNLSILYRDADAIEDVLSGTDYTYAVSVAPRMGLNQAFLGGSSDSDGTGYAFLGSPGDEALLRQAWGPRWYAQRRSDVGRTSDIIVFASAFGASPINDIQLSGFYRVTPPYFLARRWQMDKPNEATTPGQVGAVATPHGRTPVALFDGHGEMLDWEQLQDMRRWSHQADAADWTLPSL